MSTDGGFAAGVAPRGERGLRRCPPRTHATGWRRAARVRGDAAFMPNHRLLPSGKGRGRLWYLGVIDTGTVLRGFAASRNAWGAFYQAGQSCISVQRIYVHEKVYDRFMSKFTDETRKLRLGDPMLEDTDVGPVIDTASADRIMMWIEEARRQNAPLRPAAARPDAGRNIAGHRTESLHQLSGQVQRDRQAQDHGQLPVRSGAGP